MKTSFDFLKQISILLVVPILMCTLLSGCYNPSRQSDASTIPSSQEAQDAANAPNPVDWQWPESTMKEQGIDAELIQQMEQYLADEKIRINSFILIKNGYLVVEKYFQPWAQHTRSPIYSCTKSIVSALLGIAIEEGYFNGVEDGIAELLDIQDTQIVNAAMMDVTLEHILHMNAGLSAMDSYQIGRQVNAVDYIIKMPMAAKPGESFLYTCAGPHLISAAIQRATGMKTADYADKKLLEPLGIHDAPWQMDCEGFSIGGAGLQLTPEEMARFGFLYLSKGVWNGEQIVPADWIDESMDNLAEAPGAHPAESAGYGYLWWMNGFGGYSARGYGGQFIFIVPEENLVAVFTSELYDGGFFTPYEMMEHYILPALD